MLAIGVCASLAAGLALAGSAPARRFDQLALAVPGDISAQATTACGQSWCAIVPYSLTVTGGVPPYRTTCNLDPGLFTVGAHVITCYAQDAVGSYAYGSSFTIAVTAPAGGGAPPAPPPPPPLALAVPVDIGAQATTACGQSWCAIVPYSLTVTGGVPPYRTTCNLDPGLFTVGAHVITCYAQDAVGSYAYGSSFTIAVTAPAGGGAPPAAPPPAPLALTVPADINAAATMPCGQSSCAVVPYSLTVTGGVAPTRTTCNLDPGLFTVGSHTVSCYAQDAVGSMTSTKSFTVSVTAQAGAAAAGGGAAGGASGGGGSGGASGSAPAATGSAAPRDAAPRDTTAPAIARHGGITLDATSSAGAVATFAVTAVDAGSRAAISASCSPASGSTFALGPRGATRRTTVTCRARDAAGNAAVPMSFTVTVLGALDQLEALAQQVRSSTGLGAVERRALLASLDDAQSHLTGGATTLAQAAIRAFTARADSLRSIGAHRASWARAATRILAVTALT